MNKNFKLLVFLIVLSVNYAVVLGATYDCSDCTNCNSNISSASSGDTVRLNQSIYDISNTCINFNGVDNITFDCQGFTVGGDGGPGADNGIILSQPGGGSNNNTVKNCKINGFSACLQIAYSNNNTIINSNFSTCQAGLRLNSAHSNNLSYIVTSSNQNGIYTTNSNYNRFWNISVFNNSQNGVYISYSDSNTLTNISSYANAWSGILLYSSSTSNNITDSSFIDNGWGGIKFDGGGFYPSDNLIYNNFFNNTNNVNNSGSTSTNYFNTSLTSGTNIIGGSLIGGNYWAVPVGGTGFSTTCSDYNGDGICFQDYNLSNGTSVAWDFHPLTNVEPGCSDCDDCNIAIAAADPLEVIRLNSDIYNDSGPFCISFSGKDNITFDCQGNTIDGTKDSNSYGMNMQTDSNYNNIKNCNVEDFHIGIIAFSSDFNNFSNLSILNNNNSGMYFDGGMNNTMEKIVVSSNIGQGITFRFSDSNIIQYSNFSSNNQSGIYLWAGSNYNEITNSYFISNDLAGIWFDETGASDPDYNYIYNNYFNNSENVLIEDSISGENYFNTTLNCTIGLNIIGGSCIGGNFWATPSGTGFSENCADSDGDSICDNYKDMTNGISVAIDYLPLTETLSCITCPECEYKVQHANPGDTITLKADIIGHNEDCIDFAGQDNVAFDCNYHTINGPGSGGYYGIHLRSASDFNTIQNCNNISGFNTGISIQESSSNTLYNVRTYANADYGIKVNISSGNYLTSVTANSNNYGVYIANSGYVNISGLIASSNFFVGLFLSDSSNNILEGLTLSSNTLYGAEIYGNSASNTIKDSNILSNIIGGVYLAASGSSPINNRIYNNILNNSGSAGNIKIDNTIVGENYFNSTKDCSQKNIFGGPCIGGNFYSNSTADFSQTCQNIVSPYSFCDSYLNMTDSGALAYDYLPLTYPNDLVKVYSNVRFREGVFINTLYNE